MSRATIFIALCMVQTAEIAQLLYACGSSRLSVYNSACKPQTVPSPDAGEHEVTKHPPIHGLLTSDTTVSQICAEGRDSCEPASGNIPGQPFLFVQLPHIKSCRAILFSGKLPRFLGCTLQKLPRF